MRKKEIELCDNGTMTTTIANSTNTTVTNNTTQTTCRHDIFTMVSRIYSLFFHIHTYSQEEMILLLLLVVDENIEFNLKFTYKCVRQKEKKLF